MRKQFPLYTVFPMFAYVFAFIGFSFVLLLLRWSTGFALRRLFTASDSPEGHYLAEFILGSIAFKVMSYLGIIIARDAKAGIVSTCILLIAAVIASLYNYHGSSKASLLIKELWAPVKEHLTTRWGKISLLLVLGFAAALALVRFPWLLHLTIGPNVVIGTPIWDDMRNIGFPLSLAANGFPLKSPYSSQIELVYTIGLYADTAGLISIFPGFILPLLVADSFLLALFYGICALTVACHLLSSNLIRFLCIAAILINPSFNLWHLKPDPNNPIFKYFFDYYTWSNFYTTIAWTSYDGAIWVPNHCFALGAVTILWLGFLHAMSGGKAGFIQGNTSIMLLLLAFAIPSFSADMSVFAAMLCGLSGILILIEQVFSKEQFVNMAHSFAVAAMIAMLAASHFLFVQWPWIAGLVDSLEPQDMFFSSLGQTRYNVGVLLSGYGSYILVLPMLFQTRKWWRDENISILAVAVLASLGIFLYVNWNTIWFWRNSLLLHWLLPLFLAALWNLKWNRESSRRKSITAILWVICLLPGMYQNFDDFRKFAYGAPKSPSTISAAYEWISKNTSLTDRVVAYQTSHFRLTPDVNWLRTGNAAGESISELFHGNALIGSKEYQSTMKNIAKGIELNDYIVYFRNMEPFQRIVEKAQMPVAFENRSVIIYYVSNMSRKNLNHQDTRLALAEYDKAVQSLVSLKQAFQKADLSTKEGQAVAEQYIRLNPHDLFLSFRRVDEYWDSGQYSRAARLLELVVTANPKDASANYKLAFSLQKAREKFQAALEYYDIALKLGFSPFLIYYNRGSLLLTMGRKEEARVDLLRAMNIHPKHSGVQLLLNAVK